VAIIVIEGKIIVGFDESAIKDALESESSVDESAEEVV